MTSRTVTKGVQVQVSFPGQPRKSKVRYGQEKEEKADAQEAKKQFEEWGRRAGSPPSLSGLLNYLDSEFPECLESFLDEIDIEETAWQLARKLEKQRDPRLLELAEQFVKLSPIDPGVQTILVSGYFQNGYPALALKVLRALLSGRPDLEDLHYLEEQRRIMEEALSEQGEELELFIRQDEARYALSRGRFNQLEKIARDTLKLYPSDAPTRNNLSIAYFQQERVESALKTALEVLNDCPENVHSLANVTRYALALGKTEEAENYATRLKSSQSDGFERWEKTAEALSLLGDFEGVLEVYRKCPEARKTGLLHHFAAVAQARRGEWKPARKNWQQALRLSPGLGLAEANLENSKLPAEERHGAWPFEMSHWFPSSKLRDEVGRALGNGKILAKLVDRMPYLRNTLPILLERAGPNCVRFAVGLALGSDNPEVKKMLVPFALGRDGSDEIRSKALQGCRVSGLIPNDRVRFWRKGEWTELLMTEYNITWEPEGEPYPKQVEKAASRALELVNERRLGEAEELFHQCLEMLPGTPEFLNNLAVIYDARGERDRVKQTLEHIHRTHPEYSRAAISLASLALNEGRIKEARDLLRPLQEKSRFHVSEFGLFCDVQIRLCKAEGDQRRGRALDRILGTIGS